jgi:thiamine biosynthesis lipoprotein
LGRISHFDEQGQRYSHVLDARTGRPVTHDTVSVTVIHDDPTLADAWSTALLCLGSDDGIQVANSAGIAALFIAQQDDQLLEQGSKAWQSMKTIEVK